MANINGEREQRGGEKCSGISIINNNVKTWQARCDIALRGINRAALAVGGVSKQHGMRVARRAHPTCACGSSMKKKHGISHQHHQ